MPRKFGFEIWNLRFGDDMAVPENVKKMWIEIQRKYDFPVNAIGVRINQKDSATLKVWKEEGIDQFQKK